MPDQSNPVASCLLPPACIIGVDTGGTFTDVVIVEAEGNLEVRKLPSTPADPSQSVLAALAECREDGMIVGAFDVVHGTTVATNALLERQGAKTALITTAGFRDVLEIGRQTRSHLYALHPTRPAPLLDRSARFELRERLDWQGNVLVPLDLTETEALLDELKAGGFESLAVCFLFSYLNPVHERLVAELAREYGFHVSLSCDISPEPREYERTATTVANAFVAPRMAHYLTHLETQLAAAGASRLRVMQSNGGALSAQEAANRAIATALSGPAGGVIAASRVGLAAGFADLLTFDMGGTSTDVALIVGGQCPVVTEGRLGDLPLRTPLLDIHTVGAGGGSLARLDRGGGLRVGPQSAGAFPGPVAYGQGETLTVTDANILLGRLPDDLKLAGRLPLDGARVRFYFDAFARALGCAPELAAQGILDVANAAMTRALRHVSVERGHDPAGFTLLSFGGAGGLHACALAEALNMTRILVPRYPGAFSALGLAWADVRREYAQAIPPLRLDSADMPSIAARLTRMLNALYASAESDMRREGFAAKAWQAQLLLDMRYVGQSFELRVPMAVTAPEAGAEASGRSSARASNVAEFPMRAPILLSVLAPAVETFHTLHAQRFGYADVGEPVQITMLRLLAIGSAPFPGQAESGIQYGVEKHSSQAQSTNSASAFADDPLQKQTAGVAAAAAILPSPPMRQVYHSSGWQPTPFYKRTEMPVACSFSGPALVVQEDATTYVAPGWQAITDANANLLLTR